MKKINGWWINNTEHWNRSKKNIYGQIYSSQLTCVCWKWEHQSSETLLSMSSSQGLQGGRVFFNAVKEGDLVMFACDDESDRVLWVQAMYRATGQSYKPVPPLQNKTTNCRGAIQKAASPISEFHTDFFSDENCWVMKCSWPVDVSDCCRVTFQCWG